MDANILILPIVEARTGLDQPTIFERIAAGDFPEPIYLGESKFGWIEDEIVDYLSSQCGRKRRTES